MQQGGYGECEASGEFWKATRRKRPAHSEPRQQDQSSANRSSPVAADEMRVYSTDQVEGSAMRHRFSITSMMATILVIALCLAALRINSVLWSGTVLLVTLALLCAATFMSITEGGAGRLAWIGCAVFGWTCFLLGF